MRASELLASRVVDAAGEDLGPIRDVRIRQDAGGLQITALVVGDGRFADLAHAAGVAEGRVQGPWLLARICRQAIRRARLIDAADVTDWGPGTVRVAVHADDLRPLNESRA